MKLYHVRRLLTGHYSFADFLDFWIGNLRYPVYYSKKWYISKLMRKHIREQINLRISIMDRECYNNGSCKICGCRTTNLQMARKSCEGKCYPPMVGKRMWKLVRDGVFYVDRDTYKRSVKSLREGYVGKRNN